MVEGLTQEGKENPPKRISLDQSKIPKLKLGLHDFVTVNTLNFSKILGLPHSSQVVLF